MADQIDFREFYDALVADGAELPAYDEFKDFLTKPGQEGYKNRYEFYNALKADGAGVPDTYEEFRGALFAPVKTQAQAATQGAQASTGAEAPGTVAGSKSATPDAAPGKGYKVPYADRMNFAMGVSNTLNNLAATRDAGARQRQRIKQANVDRGLKSSTLAPSEEGPKGEYLASNGEGFETAREAQLRTGEVNKILDTPEARFRNAVENLQAAEASGDTELANRLRGRLADEIMSEYPADERMERVQKLREELLKDDQVPEEHKQALKASPMGVLMAQYMYQDNHARRLDREMEEKLNGGVLNTTIQGAVGKAWNAAEKSERAKTNQAMSRYNFQPGEPRIVTLGASMAARDEAHMTEYDLNKLMKDAWDQLGVSNQKFVKEKCREILQARYPGLEGEDLEKATMELAKQQVGRQMFEYAKGKNAPTSVLDYLRKKFVNSSSWFALSQGMARLKTGAHGDLPAADAALQEYESGLSLAPRFAGGLASVAGMVTGPEMIVGGVVGKGATLLTSKLLGRLGTQVVNTAARGAAARMLGSEVAQKYVLGMVGGMANFGTFEFLGEGVQQFKYGGRAATEKDSEEAQMLGHVYGDYSFGDMVFRGAHGVVMGGIMGAFSTLWGNATLKATRAVENTVGKAATKVGMSGAGLMSEGTIFSAPDWIEIAIDDNMTSKQKKDAFLSVWTSNLEVVAAFKVHGALKVKGIKETIDHFAKDPAGRKSMETRLREWLDRDPSGSDLALNKIEKQELDEAGWNLDDLFNSDGLNKEKLTELINDTRLSESARAKMHYYATGKALPMSRVVNGDIRKDKDGNFAVRSYSESNGVVTCKYFKTRKEADAELGRINRQIELNVVEMAEAARMNDDLENKTNAAVYDVCQREGWSADYVAEVLNEATKKQREDGSVELDEAKQKIFETVSKAVEGALKGFNPAEKVVNIKDEVAGVYAVDLDAALGKEPNRRTEAEQAAIDEYTTRLAPDLLPKVQEAKQQMEETKARGSRIMDVTSGYGYRDPQDPEQGQTYWCAITYTDGRKDYREFDTEEARDEVAGMARWEMETGGREYAPDPVEDMGQAEAAETYQPLAAEHGGPYSPVPETGEGSRAQSAAHGGDSEPRGEARGTVAEDGGEAAGIMTGGVDPGEGQGSFVGPDGGRVYVDVGELVTEENYLALGFGREAIGMREVLLMHEDDSRCYTELWAPEEVAERLDEFKPRGSRGQSEEETGEGTGAQSAGHGEEARTDDGAATTNAAERTTGAEAAGTVAETAEQGAATEQPAGPTEAPTAAGPKEAAQTAEATQPTEATGPAQPTEPAEGVQAAEQGASAAETALGRIPKNEKGKPDFVAAPDVQTAWEGLVESKAKDGRGEEKQRDMAVKHAEIELEGAKKRLEAVDKLKRGKDEDTDDYLERVETEREKAEAEVEAWSSILAEAERESREAERTLAEIERLGGPTDKTDKRNDEGNREDGEQRNATGGKAGGEAGGEAGGRPERGGLVRNEYSSRLGDAGADLLDTVGRHMGVRIRFGTREESIGNAYYDRENGEIIIAEDLMRPGEGDGPGRVLNIVFGHELTHHLHDEADPQMWNAFREAVVATVGREAFEKMKAETRVAYDKFCKEQGRPKLSDRAIEEEVLVEYAGRLLMTDEGKVRELLDRVAESGESAKSVAQRVLDWIGEMMSRLREAWRTRGATPGDRAYAERLEEMRKTWEGMYEYAAAKERETMEAAAKEAADYVASHPEVGEDIRNDEAAFEDNPDGKRFSLKREDELADESLKYFDEKIAKTREPERKKPEPLNKREISLSREDLEKANGDIAEMRDYIEPYYGLQADGNRYLPDDTAPARLSNSTIFPNGSYGKTVENTLICDRTLAYNEFVNAVKDKLGSPLTARESFLASQMVYDIAVDPQCLYCYVSLDRKAYDEYLINYIRTRDAAMDAYRALKDKSDKKAVQAVYREFLDGRKDTPNMRARFENWCRIEDSGERFIGLEDLRTKAARDAAREDATWQIKDAEAYAQSASWAKKEADYRSYNGELLRISARALQGVMSQYGLRFYSFSEYTPAFILENMQQVRDASLRGLKGFAYTKKTDFARIFASTGMNINISCYGSRDSKGEMVADTRQGADWEEVKKLREEYPGVGSVFVVTNDADLEWALNQDWIDVIIPFHIVRTGEDIAKFYKWTNYTADSADKNRDKNDKKHIYPHDHLNNKERFLKLCEEHSIEPRFANVKLSDGRSVVEHPNYMKLVNETRRRADETPLMRPEFNLDAAKESFDKFIEKGGYYGGYWEHPEAFEAGVEQVVDDIRAGRQANEVDYGRQDWAYDEAEARRKRRLGQHDNKPLSNSEKRALLFEPDILRTTGGRGADAGKRFSVYGGNSGYVGYSMSKRAAEAREEGRFPRTDFKKEYKVSDKALDLLVAAGVIDDSEWHHTSKFGNKTTFFGWAEDQWSRVYADNKKEIDQLAKDYAQQQFEAKEALQKAREEFLQANEALREYSKKYGSDNYGVLTEEELKDFDRRFNELKANKDLEFEEYEEADRAIYLERAALRDSRLREDKEYMRLKEASDEASRKESELRMQSWRAGLPENIKTRLEGLFAEGADAGTGAKAPGTVASEPGGKARGTVGAAAEPRHTVKTGTVEGLEKFSVFGERGATELDRRDGGSRMEDLLVAKEMAEAGRDALTIKLATGWEVGADGKWRYERPDGRFAENVAPEWSEFTFGDPLTLGDVWADDELYRAYPDMRKTTFRVDHDLDGDMSGQYDPATDEITVSADVINSGDRETVAHEIQHAIQMREGFAKGNNPANGEGRYYRSAGEVEARNVSRRLDMSEEERRGSLLSETEDVAREAQVIIEQLDGPAAFIGRKSRERYAALLEKKRPDMTDQEREHALDYLHSLEDTKENNKRVKVAVHWLANSDVNLPNDMHTIDRAIAVADQAKVDPMQYESPHALLEAHADIKIKEKPIDPETVPTLRKAYEVPEHGIVVYDVLDDTENYPQYESDWGEDYTLDESRRNMREIINTHWGEDANPWCLLQGDGAGNLSKASVSYWYHYDDVPKQVAFQNGKLLAFRAIDEARKTGEELCSEVAYWIEENYAHGLPVEYQYERLETRGSVGDLEDLDAYAAIARDFEVEYDADKFEEYRAWVENDQEGEEPDFDIDTFVSNCEIELEYLADRKFDLMQEDSYGLDTYENGVASWWDRQDNSHVGLMVETKDADGWKSELEVNPASGKAIGEGKKRWKGNPNRGQYEEINGDAHLIEYRNKEGKLEGEQTLERDSTSPYRYRLERSRYKNGIKHGTQEVYKKDYNGESYLSQESGYKDGRVRYSELYNELGVETVKTCYVSGDERLTVELEDNGWKELSATKDANLWSRYHVGLILSPDGEVIQYRHGSSVVDVDEDGLARMTGGSKEDPMKVVMRVEQVIRDVYEKLDEDLQERMGDELPEGLFDRTVGDLKEPRRKQDRPGGEAPGTVEDGVRFSVLPVESELGERLERGRYFFDKAYGRKGGVLSEMTRRALHGRMVAEGEMDSAVALENWTRELAGKDFAEFGREDVAVWRQLKKQCENWLGERITDEEFRRMVLERTTGAEAAGTVAGNRGQTAAHSEDDILDTDGVRFSAFDDMEELWGQPVGIRERMSEAALRMAEGQAEDGAVRSSALQVITDNLKELLHDMRNRSGVVRPRTDRYGVEHSGFEGADARVDSGARMTAREQRKYDRVTVKRVTDLARVLLRGKHLSELTQGETGRLLSAVKNVLNGGPEGTKMADTIETIYDILAANQERAARRVFEHLLRIKGTKVDARGVEVQAQLDSEGTAMYHGLRRGMGMMSEKDIVAAIEECDEKISDYSGQMALEAVAEKRGLELALKHMHDIKQSKADEDALRQQVRDMEREVRPGSRTREELREFEASVRELIQQKKLERADAYRELTATLAGHAAESVRRAEEFNKREGARVQEIHHNANSDMQGRPTDEHRTTGISDKVLNNGLFRGLMAPLMTFDQMLRMFGNKSANGEGYLWNRFMRGWLDAREKHLVGKKARTEELNGKIAEIFGDGRDAGYLLSRVTGKPGVEVEFFSGGEKKPFMLTQGNLMYIYMVDKMADGRMKLRKMGIDEEAVEVITEVLDPRLRELADWAQDEFLPGARAEYNETHNRLFGASMASVENYFPLRILRDARKDKEEDLDKEGGDGITSVTGAIKKRTVNSLALDILNSDAVDVLLEHIDEMEHWNAYAEFNRDLNTLRTYSRFRNQVKNMKSVYGSGEELWSNFIDMCQLVTDVYRPKKSKLDKALTRTAKGVSAAKVSMRAFTALKQLLSAPAYAPEVDFKGLAKSIANPLGDFRWALENMPLFAERWGSKFAGDPRMLKGDADWTGWRGRVFDLASKVGMAPNAFVDAVTVAIGSRAMYEARRRQYIKEGYETAQAEERARQDATILFNQTQQSAESAFLSTMQVDRTWASTLLTLFRNASISYTRQEYDAIRNLLRNNFMDGQKEKSIEFMRKQILRDWGADPEATESEEWQKADKAARKRFARQNRKDLARVATFGFILQLAWNLGAYAPYLLFGDDSDEKKKMAEDSAIHALYGSVEGLTGGDVYSSALNMWTQGDWNVNALEKHMPATTDLYSALEKLSKGKNAEALNGIVNLVFQSGFGFNPQSIEEGVFGILDSCGGDAELGHEAAIAIMRILNCPPSQIDKMYFDEVGLSGAEASKLTPRELAERYAEAKVKRDCGMLGYFNKDARVAERREKGEERIKERLMAQGDKESRAGYEALCERFKDMKKLDDKAEKLIKGNGDELIEGLKLRGEMASIPDYARYKMFKDFDKDLGKLANAYLRAMTPEDAERAKQAVLMFRASMVKAVNLDPQSEAYQAELEKMGEAIRSVGADFR